MSWSARLPDGPQSSRLAFLTDRPFAHRGLHEGLQGAGASENGMAAFDAAIAGGYGIECDVRLSSDGVAFVFHDVMLDRMTDGTGPVERQSAARLDRAVLRDGGAIPRLSTLLALTGRHTPLLIEIKVDGRNVEPVCAAVAGDLAVFADAPVAVMSFNPVVMRWFTRKAPTVVRGLVVTQGGKGRWRGRIERALALWLAKPDFLACDISDLPSAFAKRARSGGMPVLSWTVRTARQRAIATAHVDQIICERLHD